MHKRDSHPSAADELAGFEDLDHLKLVLKTARVPRFVGAAMLPSSATNARLGASSVMARSAGMSLLSTVSSSTRPVLSSTCLSSPPSSNVVRTLSGKTGDSYFTYRIAHDADGRVQAYECDVCGFRSANINEMFTHASTHSLADLAKSGAAAVNNVIWECFYCSFSAPLQASVVSHVIASHPNQPIQLKRLPTTPAAATTKTVAELASSKAVSLASEMSSLPADQQPSSEKTAMAPATSAINGPAKPAELKAEKKKKSDSSDDGCIWGCYYCTMQSASRNDIISHLKKQHSSEKLVVTRRRITHVATGSSRASSSKQTPSLATPLAAAAGIGSEEDETPNLAIETSPTSGMEVASGESTGADGSDRVSKSRKRQLSVSASGDNELPVSLSSLTADSGESNDGNQTITGSAAAWSAKSRRKQMAPRRVADEIAATAAAAAAAVVDSGDKTIINNNASLAAVDSVKSLSAIAQPRLETLPVASNTGVSTGNSRSLLASSSIPRKHGRSSTSKYDSLIKKLKMADVEENGLEISGLLEKPRLDEPPKTSASRPGKALSLLTGQLVSGYVQPPNSVPTLSLSSHDLLPPVLNPESSPSKQGWQSSGLKVGVIQYVDKKAVDRSQCYVYDAERQTARCGICGTTARGSHVLRQISEHVAAHFNECRWACVYCIFECSHRAMIVGHVTQRHRDLPLRMIHRRHCHNNRTGTELTPHQPRNSLKDVRIRGKLRGPRCHREKRHIASTDVMWQCAFCSRRSLFRGLIAIHMKLAHYDQDSDLHRVPQRWLRPGISIDATTQDVDMKQGKVCLVRIEDIDRYPALSNVILCNGADLIQELDVDDEDGGVAEMGNVFDGNGDVAEFRCIHCHFRGSTATIVKCHILQSHRLEDVTILDLRSSRRLNHEHLFMCRNVECQFASSIQKDFRAHINAYPSHSTNSVTTTNSHSEPKLVDHPQQMSAESRNIKISLSDTSQAMSVSARTAVGSSGAKTRRGTDGPIEYNDDGTLRGLELGNRAFSMQLQCTHCCTTMSCDVGEMRNHLSGAHSRLVPLAIDVECTDSSLPASLFFCLIAGCDFITSYYNVYKHHMDEEHPDSEAGSASRRHHPAIRRRSAPSVQRGSTKDRSFTANIRRSKKPTNNLNSSVDNGHYSSSMSAEDVAVRTMTDDVDTPPISKKSSSHYSSQDFDFSRRYKCVLCSHTAATLADMKSHLTSCHDSTTVHQCIDRRARQLRKRQGVYFCPDPNCAFCCKFDDELAVHVDQEHPSLVGLTGATVQSKMSCQSSEDSGCAGDRVYQCAHCTYITTNLRNVRVHVVAEHATTEGGFAEIKTAVSSDGSVIMNVNDATSSKSSSAADRKSVLANGDNLAAKVKVDDEGKVFAVL